MHKALMLDHETLSLEPNAFLLQIGVGMVDLDTGAVLFPPTNFYLRDAEQVGRHVDPGTVRWWQQQDRGVAASVFTPVLGTTLSVAQLWEKFVELAPDTVWAWPSSFDLVQQRDLFGRKTPWSRHAQRCCFSLASELDPRKELQPPPNNMHHNAAADVDWQLRYLLALQPRLRAAREFK